MYFLDVSEGRREMRGGGEGREKGGRARGQRAERGEGGCSRRRPSKKSLWKIGALGYVRKVFENELSRKP